MVEAEQYRGGSSKLPRGLCLLPCLDGELIRPHIHTIHNNQSVVLEEEDWVVAEPDGKHFYAVKPDIFAATYERACNLRTRMKALCLLATILVLACLPSRAQSLTNPPANLTLAWDAVTYTNAPITNYTLWFGPSSGTYTKSVPTQTNLVATVSNLVRGSTYYFAVTCTASNGLSSAYSSEVQGTVPLPPTPPILLRVISN